MCSVFSSCVPTGCSEVTTLLLFCDFFALQLVKRSKKKKSYRVFHTVSIFSVKIQPNIHSINLSSPPFSPFKGWRRFVKTLYNTPFTA